MMVIVRHFDFLLYAVAIWVIVIVRHVGWLYELFQLHIDIKIMTFVLYILHTALAWESKLLLTFYSDIFEI